MLINSCASLLLVAVLGCVLAGCVGDPSPRSTSKTAAAGATESARLQTLVDGYFEDYLQLFPVEATFIGDPRYNDRLTIDISEDHRARQRTVYTRYLTEAGQIARSQLSPQDGLTYDLFCEELTMRRQRLDFPEHLLPVDQLWNVPILLQVLGSGASVQPFKTVKDYENFLGRLGVFPAWVDTAIANMRAGIAQGIVQPRVVIDRVLPQWAAIATNQPAATAFWQPVKSLPASFPEGEKARLRQAYQKSIEQQIIPAYRRLYEFVRDEYLPRCRETVALSALPRGREWYAFRIKENTTTDLGPDEIYELGWREVERIRGEMRALQQRVGFSGSLADFREHLYRVGQRYATKPDLVAAYACVRNTVEPRLTELFGRLPKAPFEIRTVEEFREASAPSQYWPPDPDGSRPGVFYVNASGLQLRPMAISEALFLHEAVPGHHFQIALTWEQAELPRFRRFGGRYTAYVEGWALYAESLGSALGCYREPLQQWDRLVAELWRAQRLVVDTGLHHKGWSQEHAIQFMRETPEEPGEAEREVDRYIADPGQALAYKIGELRIRELRNRAAQRLGSKFDLRGFHDAILREGALPLNLLETRVEEWIEQQTRNQR